MKICENCRVGRCRLTTGSYMTWLDDQVVIAPNVPIYLCDVCGETEYDEYYLNHLQLLLEGQEGLDGAELLNRRRPITADPAETPSERPRRST